MAQFEVNTRPELMFLQNVVVGDEAYVIDENILYQFIGGDVANLANWIRKAADGRVYSGGLPYAVGADVQSNRPWDERDFVHELDDLKTLYNAYDGIEVKVRSLGNNKYRWNGIDQSNLDNWKLVEPRFYRVVGEDTVENIKLKSCIDPAYIWLTTDNGIDECGNSVGAGYGMVCETGTWCNIGRLTGIGVPEGGLVNQVLKKSGNNDYQTTWEWVDSEEVRYDNIDSTLNADDVKEAIDELDDKIEVIYNPPNLSNLNYVGHSRYIEIPSEVATPLFSWTNINSPNNVRLWDSAGALDEDVTGLNSFQSSDVWQFATNRTVTWYIEGDYTDRKSITTTSVHGSYTGKNNTGNIPTESEILAGTKHIVPTNISFTSYPNTLGTEFGWFVVENTQTGAPYNEWYVDEFNNGDIGNSEFIRYDGLVLVNGVNHQVYIYNYPSTLNQQIILR